MNKLLSLTCAGLLLGSSCLIAEWGVRVRGGFDLPSSGTVHRGPTFDAGPLVNDAVDGGGSLSVDVDEKGYDDIYDELTTFGIAATYTMNDSLGYALGIDITQGDGNALRVGTVAPGALDLAFDGEFGDFDATSVYGSVLWNTPLSNALRLTLEVEGGIRFVDSIDATFSVPAVPGVFVGGNDTLTVPLYEDSNVFYGGLRVTFDYAFSDRTSVGFSTGLLGQTSLEADDSAIGGLPDLEPLNNEGDLGYIPVMLTFNYRF
jgi:hypothetical protein